MKTSPDGSRGSKGFKSPLPGAGLSRHRCSRGGVEGAAGPARRPRQRFPAGPFPRRTARLRCSAGATARSVPGRGALLPSGEQGASAGERSCRGDARPRAAWGGAAAGRPGAREAWGCPGRRRGGLVGAGEVGCASAWP